MSSSSKKAIKLLLIGDSGVGKSCILLRYTDNAYDDTDEPRATIGVDFKVQNANINGADFKVYIWDTAGQERYRTLTSSFYRGAQAVFVVFDLGSRETFEHIPSWFKEVDVYCSKKSVVKCLVGNKADTPSRQVSYDEAKQYAESLGALYHEVSAKTNQGITDMFQDIITEVAKTPHLSRSSTASSSSSSNVSLSQQPAKSGSWASMCSC
ncbi:hypothetical protein RI367_002761 [Sorochytrium milnesiophthora]